MATVMRRTYHSVVVVGNSGVGKTSLLNQYIHKKFSVQYESTEKTTVMEKEIVDKERLVRLEICDTSRYEKKFLAYTAIPDFGLVCVLVYDVNDESSFDSLDSWYKRLVDEESEDYSDDILVFILIGTKIDKDGGNSRSVSEKSALDWCAANGNIPYFETSAKEDHNVDAAFLSAANTFISRRRRAFLSSVEKEEEEEEMEEEENFDNFETEMDVLCFIKERIYQTAVISFLQSQDCEDEVNKYLNKLEIFITTTPLKVQHADNRLKIMKIMLVLACETKNFTKNFFKKKLTEESDINSYVLHDFLFSLAITVSGVQNWENESQKNMQFAQKLTNSITNSLHDVKKLEMFLLDKEDNSTCIPLNLESQELLLIKAFPALVGLKEPSDMVNLILKLNHQLTIVNPRTSEHKFGLSVLAHEISELCSQDPQTVMLIGCLLSLKRPNTDTWQRVLKDLRNKDRGMFWASDSHTWARECFSYCLEDLVPESLRLCFLYLACYPKGYEIPTASVTKIWIAEGFITPEEGETPEERVNKYLEQLIERSLIWVSMRSLSGTIKKFRLSHTIRNYAIHFAMLNNVLVVNPDEDKMTSFRRVAIHNDDHNQYTEVKCIGLNSFLAFAVDRNVLGGARLLTVLELRDRSVVRETLLEKMPHLKYLGLRGSEISNLPENIGDMQNLQTLDVRDTKVQILPESLWKISTLCHVHVNPEPRIQGPPPTANIPNLQTLKTVVVPDSWLEKVPNLSINLRKLALSYAGHLELETISKPLSLMINLLSIALVGPIVHAELADTRGFPNLNTLKSIKFVGTWNFRKLSIDNVEFPSNLVKLILSNSCLKEDPMPRLERLLALKLLRLEDEAYTGEKMVCSSNGFPQLQSLQLSKLENLKIWEVQPMAMLQLTTLHVVKCKELKINLPDLKHVKDIVIDNYRLVPYVHV